MKISAEIGDRRYTVDLQAARPIAIPLDFSGPQPNHFGVSRAAQSAVEAGEFVGDTRRGGSCNVARLSLIPHCNGTHTESVGHIVDERLPVGSLAATALFPAILVTVPVVEARGTDESYRPEPDHHDWLMTRRDLATAVEPLRPFPAEALVIRTRPNREEKKTLAWGDDRQPAFLTMEAMRWIVDQGFDHLLLDMPSVDKMYDEGLLTNHHIFWNVPEGTHQQTPTTAGHRTITEMVFVEDEIADGRYLLNLQFAAFQSDAAPSRPILFPLTES